MPVKSKAQERLMQAVANNPAFAKKVGISKKVADKFVGPKAHKESDMKKPATKTAQKPKKFLAGGITGRPVFTPPATPTTNAPARTTTSAATTFAPRKYTSADALKAYRAGDVAGSQSILKQAVGLPGNLTSADALRYQRQTGDKSGAQAILKSAVGTASSTPNYKSIVSNALADKQARLGSGAKLTSADALAYLRKTGDKAGAEAMLKAAVGRTDYAKGGKVGALAKTTAKKRYV